MLHGRPAHGYWGTCPGLGLKYVCCTGQRTALLSPCVCCLKAVLTAKHMTATAMSQKRQGRVHLGEPCCIWFTAAAVSHLALRTAWKQQAKVDTNAVGQASAAQA